MEPDDVKDLIRWYLSVELTKTTTKDGEPAIRAALLWDGREFDQTELSL